MEVIWRSLNRLFRPISYISLVALTVGAIYFVVVSFIAYEESSFLLESLKLIVYIAFYVFIYLTLPFWALLSILLLAEFFEKKKFINDRKEILNLTIAQLLILMVTIGMAAITIYSDRFSS